MREIKFRAWDKIINEWVYFTLEELCNEVGDFSIMKNWCQYTGLKDNNGKEIFEGDIVVEEFWNGGDGISEPNERDEFKGVIIWDKETCCFGLKTKGCKEDEIECNLVKEGQFVTLEIIGITMENKELLEGK